MGTLPPRVAVHGNVKKKKILSSTLMADFSASLNGATKFAFIVASKLLPVLFCPKKSGPVAVHQ